MSIHFGTITPENWRLFYALRVKEEQKKFVSSNVKILARAFAYRDCNSRIYAIYNEDTPIGMLMQDDYEEDSKLFCVLSQFMIAEQFQGNGYGKAAMNLWLSMIKEECKYDSIILCYIEGDEPARNLYLSMGFYHTGEADGDEIIMKYDLKCNDCGGNFNLPRIANYNLNFIVEPEIGIFKVHGVLTIENEGNTCWSQLPILLYPQLKVKKIKDSENKDVHFTKKSISIEDEENYYVNHICIDLDDSLKLNDHVDLYIEYEGSINGYPHIMAYVKDKIDKEFSILRTDCHAYPIIAEPNEESILRSDENTFTYQLLIDVPKEYAAGCGGILKDVVRTKERNIYKYISDVPTWRFDIAVAKYSIVEDKDMNLKIFVFPEHKDNAENIVKREVKRAFDLFTALFGSNGKDNYFNIIEIKESYGSQAGDNYILMEEHGFSNNVKEMTHLYHEIGHEWNARAKYDVKRTRFFDEAFASYFEALAIKKFYGDNAFKDKMELYRQYFVRDVKRDEINYSTPICDYGKYDIGHNCYTKGPWVLYALNKIVGDEIFNKIIRRFLSKFKCQEVDFNDFEEVAQEISGIDLSKFFAQWIYGTESSKFLCEGIFRP